ncbi:MAG TPA: Ig-like domain-containing protein [Mycobacterium sp.]|nr:Ig-like domain-containing protein [Mycobacterium sp.]
MTSTRRVRGACLAAVFAVVAVLGGVVLSTTPDCADHCQTLTAAPVPQAAPRPSPIVPAALSILPPAGATDVSPSGRVLVTANSGTLDTVQLVNDAGKAVPGVMTPDAKAWKPTTQLGYGRTYTLTIAARGPGGMPSRQTSSFTTLTPSNQTELYLETTAGGLLQDGATYGVGTVVVAKFDEPIDNKANAEGHLVVTTNPPVAGSWNWIDDQTAHWRPQKYYTQGTSITVTADIYGAPLGDGLYGQDNEQVSFRIGDSHVSIADDTTKQVSVFDNGNLVRTMPTSMGMGGTETIGGTTLSFWTPPGIYTVMDKANPVIMDSSTFGLPINSRLGYRETIPYATRISPDGIYLHQLNATVWAQGNTNTSHGCLNLNGDNAKWFYDFSVPGDVVEVRNTGGRPLQLWQNGDWSVPWDQWRKGSAQS